MVGIGTVLADNPSLTTRLSVPGLQPIRLVVDSNLRIPMDATLIKDKTAPTWIFTTDHAPIEKEKILNEQGIVVYRCGEGPHVDLHKMMQVLSQLEISSILLEGGGKLAGAMLEANYIHKVAWFIAPKLVGGNTSFHPLQWHGIATMNDAITLEQLSFTQLDNDILIEGIVNYEQK
jgi:diaminohydroxyphosphoribosylaminopyrimidine deaminase/5-amino-6-(5-phosphoribosylamino)uracil reductase